MALFGKTSFRAGAAVTVLALLTTVSPASAFYPRPGTTVRINLTPSGQQSGSGPLGSGCAVPPAPQNCITQPVISANGRYIAWASEANDLVEGDLNLSGDVFRWDSKTNRIELAGLASDGSQPLPELSDTPASTAISANGRFVGFASSAPNLVPLGQDLNAVDDYFVHDMTSGNTQRVTVAADGGDSNGSSNANVYAPSMAPNGKVIAFSSDASNLVAGDTNGVKDAFVRDLRTGVTERVSVGTNGAEANGPTLTASISPSGRFVAIASEATNLVPEDTNMARDVFIYDRQEKTTERISVRPDGSGVPLNLGVADLAYGTSTSFSKDERFIVFRSTFESLVPYDSVVFSCDFFVRDLKIDRTQRVSVASDGSEREGGCGYNASITPDGRFVTFNTSQPLAPDDGDCTGAYPIAGFGFDSDLYAFDLVTGATELVSRSTAREPSARDDGACAGIHGASLSADGRFSAYSSTATNLAEGDTNGLWDVFLTDRGLPLMTQASGGVAFSKDSARDARSPVPIGPEGELIGMTVAERPELEDVYFKLDVQELSVTAAATRSLTYGIRFRVGDDSYEVRTLAGGLADRLGAGFALFRCDSIGCTQEKLLPGGYGTTGSSIVVAVPFTDVGLGVGSLLQDVHGFSAIANHGALGVIDSVALDD